MTPTPKQPCLAPPKPISRAAAPHLTEHTHSPGPWTNSQGLRGDAGLHGRRVAGGHDRRGLDRCADIPCGLGALEARLGGAQTSRGAASRVLGASGVREYFALPSRFSSRLLAGQRPRFRFNGRKPTRLPCVGTWRSRFICPERRKSLRRLRLPRQLDDRFHETGIHGTDDLLTDSSFAIG
jgi:hypothetical protein